MEPVLDFLKSLAPNALTLVSLIFLDVVLGIAHAIREKRFSWREVGDFYLTMVLPFLIGWLAFSITAQFASTELLGDEYGELIGSAATWTSWLAIVAVIGNSVLSHAKFLYGEIPFSKRTKVIVSDESEPLQKEPKR